MLRLLIFLIAIVLPVHPLFAGSLPEPKTLTEPPTFSESQQADMEKGKPVIRSETFEVDGFRAGRGVAYVLIDATPEQVFAQILDYNHYKQFYPHVAQSEIYKQQGDLYFVKFHLKLTVVSVVYHCRHKYDKANNYLSWTLDDLKKNDFKKTEGFWKAWPRQKGKTLLAYSILVESGRDVPRFLQDMATGYGLKKVASCMKQRVESKKMQP